MADLNELFQGYSLNDEEQRVLRIIADYALGKTPLGPQLRMIVSGRAGTGKSLLIHLLDQWVLN